MTTTSTSSLAPPPHHEDDTKQRILIASFVGVAIVLVMILLFAIYCYNKRNPIQSRHRYSHRSSDTSGAPSRYVYENKGLQYSDQDSSNVAHDISIKLKIEWDDLYYNTDSEKYKTLQNQLVESMEELYKQYYEFRGAILMKLRKGSVIADIRLKFSKLAVEPLNIIKKAVAQGKCSRFEVEKDYLYFPERRARHRRSDKTESGYGSQVFEQISFVDNKTHEQRLRTSRTNSAGSKSSFEAPPTIGTLNTVSSKSDVENKAEKKEMDGRSSSHRIKSKKKHVTDVPKDEGRHHVARFDFHPQDYRELALHQGELVRITCIDAGGWVKVANGSGEEGWVPRNFIAEIDQEDYVNTKKAVESIIFLDQMIESAADVPDVEKVEDPITTRTVEEIKITPELADNYENMPTDDLLSEDNLSGLFVAIFPFDPTDDKEIRLEVGDLVDVSRTSETGWWKGCCIRTNDLGWFPSTYVKPKSAEMNFHSFFGDLSHVEESVSDSELHSSKRSPIMNGYYSDGEGNKVEDKYVHRGSNSLKLTSFNYEDSADSRGKKEGATGPNEIIRSSGSFSIAEARARKNVTDGGSTHLRSASSVGCVNYLEPPAKPVPPKPRKQHIKQTYQRLAAEGQLFSANDTLSRSLESLRVRSKSCSRRSFSEEIFSQDGESNRRLFVRPIEKDRPLSFQGTPRFLQLANRYASSNMKASWSLPSLNGDQMIKLSPDDDRPYLDPIPRKHKTSSVELLDSKIQSGDLIADEYIELNPNYIPERLKPASPEVSKCEDKTVRLVVDTRSGVATPEINEVVTRPNEPPPKPERESLKYGFSVRLTSNDDDTAKLKTTSPSLGSVSDKHLPACACASHEQCECETDSKLEETKPTDEVFTTLKPCTRFRNSSNRNFSSSFESIHEEGESNSKKESRDESLEDCCTTERTAPIDDDKSSNGDHRCSSDDHLKPTASEDHKYKTEPKYANVTIGKENPHLKYKYKHHFRKINSFGEEESEEDSCVSRTSSSLSLSSFNSSNASRSTTSSKHEQMNLRRATIDVRGQSKGELSFEAGAMLYELRPRNKEGICYGLLEDSTEGWYPAGSVEIFHASFQV